LISSTNSDLIRRVNSKVRFKRLLLINEIPTPELFDVVYTLRDLGNIPWDILEGRNIVVKPDRGSGGHGILVLRWNKREHLWFRGNYRYNRAAVTRHVRDILDGQYSKGYVADRAFFEEMLVPHRFFRQLSPRGLSDIRVVVYNNVPVMAMLRVPTVESGGRANLHAGGLGIGVDIGSGITTTAIHHDQLIAVHPDNGMRLADLKIPKWTAVLQLAMQVQQVSGLSYVGVDLVIDKHARVMIIEANARPGLAIQIANVAGLNERVNRVRNLRVHSIDHGLRLSRELFSDHEGGIKPKTVRRPVVSRYEAVEVTHPKKPSLSFKVKAKIDTGADSTSIGFTVARKIGYGKILDELKREKVFDVLPMAKAKNIVKQFRNSEFFQTTDDASLRIVKSATGVMIRVYLPLRIKIHSRTFNTHASIANRIHLSYKMIVGAKDLGGFYVDPAT
ncbi:MAG: sugar-transfer associated ATP-grasp domain-containing protein, partial [bacterium]|nr:sugar-transfer associated ATP-grasp domain-containing protein [bacterium]